MFTQTWEELLKDVDADNTAERNRKQMKSYAEEAFKDHVIVEEQPDVFRCAAPTTIIHSFRVAFLPGGMIVVYGDIGDMMVQRGGEGWLKSAIRHDYVSDYVMGKAVPIESRRWPSQEFFPGDALAEIIRLRDGKPYVEDAVNLVEQAREAGIDISEDLDDYYEEVPQPGLARKIAEDWLDWDVCGTDADAWGRAYYKHTADCEYDDCRDYNSNQLWCYFALSWFVRKRTEVKV